MEKSNNCVKKWHRNVPDSSVLIYVQQQKMIIISLSRRLSKCWKFIACSLIVATVVLTALIILWSRPIIKFLSPDLTCTLKTASKVSFKETNKATMRTMSMVLRPLYKPESWYTGRLSLLEEISTTRNTDPPFCVCSVVLQKGLVFYFLLWELAILTVWEILFVINLACFCSSLPKG